MKKSVLALGAAAALGFAGAANAIAFFGDGPATNAGAVVLNPGGLGHYLFTPYFSTQGDNSTLLSIVNTDDTNGKAVKVRFRGAANSDDILDFTVFLSPGDVWTANVSKGADGKSALTTKDNSCVLPQEIMGGNPYPFATFRLDPNLDEEVQKLHTREGYVEYLTMADVRPGSALFNATKHNSKGVATCAEAALNATLGRNVAAAPADMEALGLFPPTDGLTGSWILLRNSDVFSISGDDTAAQAVVAAVAPPALPVSATGRYAFSPQVSGQIPGALLGATRDIATADPVFYTPVLAGGVPIQWFDLPDMSTPLVKAEADPNKAVAELSTALGKDVIINEFAWQTAAPGKTPFETDWLVSQPTRRYWAAVGYDVPLVGEVPLYNGNAANVFYTPANLNMRWDRVVNGVNLGSFLCMNGELNGFNREEGGIGASSSPGPISDICGEVFTLSFQSDTSNVLGGKIANTKASITRAGQPVNFGWAELNLPKAVAGGRLPMVGFSASHASDGVNWYGYSSNHRWR